MNPKVSVGIDIGSFQVKVMVCEHVRQNDKNLPRIIGAGSAESRGIRHGYITNYSDVVRSVRQAILQAERSSGLKIKKAYISAGGIGLKSLTANGAVAVSRADQEITDLDVNNAIESAENSIPGPEIINRKIIHTIPTQFTIDGIPALGKPHGMKGIKIESKVMFVTALEQHLNDLIQAVEDAGVSVLDVIASPIAASLVTLTKTQKIAGCMLANIGSETVSVVVHENNLPVSLEVFPFGSNHITQDIALGFKIDLEEAEQVKLGILTGSDFPKKKLDEIVVARLTDIFELIEAHLKKINRNNLLPAGIIITGGGSAVGTIEDVAKSSLKLPAKLASLTYGPNGSGKIKDATWAVAYGLCILGFSAKDESPIGLQVKKTQNKLVSWIRQFLP